MDEFAVDPRAGAGVDKMRPGDPTLANGADAQPLVQPRQGILGGAQRTTIEGRGKGNGIS